MVVVIQRGQGAIEYLLLLAAAIVVVAIVVSFLGSTIGPVQDTGDNETYSYLCEPKPQGLESGTAQCACYNGNSNNYFDTTAEAKEYCCEGQNSAYLKMKWNQSRTVDAEKCS